jgi:hypothetical protein
MSFRRFNRHGANITYLCMHGLWISWWRGRSKASDFDGEESLLFSWRWKLHLVRWLLKGTLKVQSQHKSKIHRDKQTSATRPPSPQLRLLCKHMRKPPSWIFFRKGKPGPLVCCGFLGVKKIPQMSRRAKGVDEEILPFYQADLFFLFKFWFLGRVCVYVMLYFQKWAICKWAGCAENDI